MNKALSLDKQSPYRGFLSVGVDLLLNPLVYEAFVKTSDYRNRQLKASNAINVWCIFALSPLIAIDAKLSHTF